MDSNSPRPDVQVALVRHKNSLVTVQPGDDFLYGERLNESFPWQEYQGRWELRHEKQPDDATASPRGWSSYSWNGLLEGRIPWATLKSLWRREQTSSCLNCDVPLAAWTFSWRHRTLLSMQGFVARCCFVCRRHFTQDSGDLWPWLLATLDADVLPVRQHDGIHTTDLRPRWPSAARKTP